jgi:hypothetical protein
MKREWVQPVVAAPTQDLAQNDAGPGVVILVLVGSVLAFGGLCRATGGSFEATVSLTRVSVSCR